MYFSDTFERNELKKQKQSLRERQAVTSAWVAVAQPLWFSVKCHAGVGTASLVLLKLQKNLW